MGVVARTSPAVRCQARNPEVELRRRRNAEQLLGFEAGTYPLPLPPGPPVPPDAVPSAPPRPGPLPAALSLLVLVGAAAGTATWALGKERADTERTEHAGLAATLGRDMLTGRLLDADGWPVSPESGWGSAERMLQLRFVPSGDQSRSGAAVDGLVAFLERRTGYAVNGKILPSYGLVVEELVQGRCDVAFLTTASYARAHWATSGNDDPEDDVTAFLSVVRHGSPDFPGSDLAYRGAIVVRADSDLTDIRQLTPDRTIAMGNVTSTTSSLMPTAMLRSLGLAPRVHRVEGYPMILNSLLAGRVDAGCIWWTPPNPDNPQHDARILVKATHPDVFDTTRILAFTPWVPNEPVVARRAMPEEVRHVLARALCLYVGTLARTETGRRELESIGSLTGLIPARDQDFVPLLETIENALAGDPAARADFMAGAK
jgi:phosphonate transport system substrate-binding protein